MMNSQQSKLIAEVKAILADHGLKLRQLAGNDHFMVLKGQFSDFATLRGLVDVVDHYKPRLQDARLTALYN